MMRDAESHASEDTKKKEEIEARNRLDGLTYQVEKTFNENKDKLDSGASLEVENAIADAKKTLVDGSADQMNDAFNRLQTASHKLAEVIYSQAGSSSSSSASSDEQASGASASSSGTSSSTGSDDVIDAEYVDVDDEKK
jgi:molecular chaperone DnaK